MLGLPRLGNSRVTHSHRLKLGLKNVVTNGKGRAAGTGAGGPRGSLVGYGTAHAGLRMHVVSISPALLFVHRMRSTPGSAPLLCLAEPIDTANEAGATRWTSSLQKG